MTGTQAKQQNKRKADHKQSNLDSATERAFLRLSYILLEIINSDNEDGKNGVKGGDSAIQMKKRSKMKKINKGGNRR